MVCERRGVGHLVDGRRVLRVRDGEAQETPDQVAVEAPLTVRVAGVTVATTMRTPGHDLDLALGWLVAEGVVRRPDEVVEAIACDADTVDVRLAAGVAGPPARIGATTSACGICGSDSIAEVLSRRGPALTPGEPKIRHEVLTGLPDFLRAAQRAFERSGGLHAAGLFTTDGEPVCVREDVGRHNAVDKVVGWALREGLLPAQTYVLQVSGRASFELTQKAAMAGIPVLAAVSAPSTLAVDLAREAGLTLVGFVRGTSFNVYAGADRVRSPSRGGGGGGRVNDRADDPRPEQARVKHPQEHAAGVPGVLAATKHALREMGPRRTLLTLSALNQKDGFDCPGCAWPDPGTGARAEFCENGAKAVAEEATKAPRRRRLLRRGTRWTSSPAGPTTGSGSRAGSPSR